jgi:phage terminase Nu1 subunit (DNA packaging protein)
MANPTPTAANTRLKIAQASKVEMENEIRAGRLLKRDEVRERVADMIATTKSRLLQLPARARGAFPGQTQFGAWLEKELDEALNALADDAL